jgi:hypothetical protein
MAGGWEEAWEWDGINIYILHDGGTSFKNESPMAV